MERCFIIEKSAELYREYYDYKELWEKNHDTIKRFVAANITEVKGFSYAAYDDFSITLNDELYKKFSSQLKKNYRYYGKKKLYTFKKNSPIGKLYAALNIKPAREPFVLLGLDIMSARTRLFDYNGILYTTIDSDEIDKKTLFPDGWQEISKGKFYKIIDRIESEKNAIK